MIFSKNNFAQSLGLRLGHAFPAVRFSATENVRSLAIVRISSYAHTNFFFEVK